MAKRDQLSSEQINEELSRVEQELRQLTLDYVDTSKINDDLTKSIEQKELELLMKDKYLLELKSSNLAELEQLKWVGRTVVVFGMQCNSLIVSICFTTPHPHRNQKQ
jgi:hypothetical protein